MLCKYSLLFNAELVNGLLAKNYLALWLPLWFLPAIGEQIDAEEKNIQHDGNRATWSPGWFAHSVVLAEQARGKDSQVERAEVVLISE